MVYNAEGDLFACAELFNQPVIPHKWSFPSFKIPILKTSSLLSVKDKQNFFLNGFIVVPQLVSPLLMEKALKSINISIGAGISNKDYYKSYTSSSEQFEFCPDLTSSEAILNLLLQSPAFSITKELLGKVHRPGGSQIALRFPEHRSMTHEAFSKENVLRHGNWHIDGTNRKGILSDFSLLVGVYLSDIPEDFRGNFTVYPGGHFLIEEFVNNCGTEMLRNGEKPNIDLPQPLQLIVSAGDVVFAHYALPHTVAPHIGEGIRYAIYFRLYHGNRQGGQRRPETLKDLWLEYEGIENILT